MQISSLHMGCPTFQHAWIWAATFISKLFQSELHNFHTGCCLSRVSLCLADCVRKKGDFCFFVVFFSFFQNCWCILHSHLRQVIQAKPTLNAVITVYWDWVKNVDFSWSNNAKPIAIVMATWQMHYMLVICPSLMMKSEIRFGVVVQF